MFGGRSFEGPFDITAWTPPARAAVYCLLIQDRVVYFGESSDLAQRAFPSSRGGRAGWLRIADFASRIVVAAHWMPRSTFEERNGVAQKLIEFYEPECNEVTRSHSLAH
jgi:hypothetical protein